MLIEHATLELRKDPLHQIRHITPSSPFVSWRSIVSFAFMSKKSIGNYSRSSTDRGPQLDIYHSSGRDMIQDGLKGSSESSPHAACYSFGDQGDKSPRYLSNFALEIQD